MLTPARARAKKGNVFEEALAKADAEPFTWDESRTPNINREQIERFLKAAIVDYPSYYAVFAFFGCPRHKGGEIVTRGCHGYMHSTSITHSWISALRYKGQTKLNPAEMDQASRWYVEKFLLGKFSPWAVLLPYLTIVYNQNKVPVAYIVDGEENRKAIDKQLLQNFNIASRWPREFPNSVQAMYDLWISGHFKKAEALLLQNLIRFNPATGTFTAIPNGRVGGGHHYYQGVNTYRLLERKPNTGMIYKDGRFVALTAAMSSNNDQYVWGHDNRNASALQKMFDELTAGKIGKKTITRFGGVLNHISEEAVVEFMKRFRELYEGEIKRVPGGAFKEGYNEPSRAVDTDNPMNYIGAYTQTRDVATKF